MMDEVVAWYDLGRLIEAHIKDAEAREAKKNQRKKGRK